MERNITIQKITQTPMEERVIEIIERKGRGHPDYIADSISEVVSVALCKYYKKNFGIIFHHNVDKSLVVGGRANPFFGGGEVCEPIHIIVAGRAAIEILEDGKITPIPIGSIVLEAMNGFLDKNFRFLNRDKHVICNYMIRRGSVDLVTTFDSSQVMPLSNDTSFGVGYAPLSQTERVVFETEMYLNSDRVKKELPEVGEDIKVMGLRQNKHIDLTISAPQISSLTPNLEHYLSIKEEIKDRVGDFGVEITTHPIDVFVNTADVPERNVVYLTVTGTSAEQGDDGNTGRGNRTNGLITPGRPMSLEAAAGKNPVNHVGKLYNVLATQIAEKVYEEVKGIQEVYIKILSQIGKPIDHPLVADTQLILEKGISLKAINNDVKSIVDEELANIKKITNAIIEGKVKLF
ncbi:methionine adenosyltransferase [Candidatus Bathyarchaeota archaeon]|nr:methionine adenosyltransferase [Candidatus Bathyarchaeota archaeon]